MRSVQFWSAAALGLLLTATALVAPAPQARAAGETVNIALTTTTAANKGRTVTRGLQPQAPVRFTPGTGSGGTTITVNEGRTYQEFEGAGASFTDTAAWLMNSSGALTPATRDATMRKLFHPTEGIGLSFIRNPLGASDLARFDYNFDNTCCDVSDFNINHDLADVLPLTRQAKQLNPALKVMASPWSAPGWMKDNNHMHQGWLQSQYYTAFGQYFAKYVQAYQSRGVPIDYVSVQNEPTCCAGYPSMHWNANGLIHFTKNALWPAFRAAGITTKTLVLDWNWDKWAEFGAPQVNDPAIRNDPLFGGVAWHGYGGDVATQTQVHNQYPGIKQYGTEHSGGEWINDQHREDMVADIINPTRNHARSVVKWSLGLDQAQGPHNGGCGTCTGLITVQNGGPRHGQVDYTIEYYNMGHLTKFVRPGAVRVDTNNTAAVSNVAWRNPDGSKALIAYNTSGAGQNVRVNWGGQSFTYNLPARTTATFTWAGQPSGGPTGGQITGLGGKCLDVTDNSTVNGTLAQIWDCVGADNQRWTINADGTVRALGKCLDVSGNGTANGTPVHLWDCFAAPNQLWQVQADRTIRNPQSNRCLDVIGNNAANGTKLQIWDCTAAPNQQWSTA
ncbi:ricin-type beta-trefoil lectin domain protein [Crossiella cryophila]|uniref:Glucosylceramidase n=1 Tax=Crossiella cryophila TaxID=43355 RepID=A0A7W7CC25_9PSEU|nr:ricin-type beta-trefoil lectin domain protein [Crossiella cryophila]MBB4677146.1 glucosylceramidase [Crossiella cryophila]